MQTRVSKLSALETASTLAAAGGPLFAKGIIVRRPKIVALLQATGLEALGVRALQRVRARHGAGPAVMRLGVQDEAVLLSPDDVRRLLEQTPEPFATDSREKHSTLAHFQPEGALISRGADRAARRALNETALEPACPHHSFEPRFRQLVEEEIAPLANEPSLHWGSFKDAWFRLVRRCVFGDRARDDVDLIRLLIRLRGDANWAFLKPRRRQLRAHLLSRIASYLHHPEPNSLAAILTAARKPGSSPESQVGQWLFAFDAAAIATFRTLMLLASDPHGMSRAREDLTPGHAFLRACILEAVRLWPTTPAILRQADRETRWHGTRLPAGTGFAIHVPFLHRDDERLPFAHCFAPDIWLDGTAEQCPLVPFSAGPAECPAKNLVLLIGSAVVKTLIAHRALRLSNRQPLDLAALPATLGHFSTTFAVEPLPAAS